MNATVHTDKTLHSKYMISGRSERCWVVNRTIEPYIVKFEGCVGKVSGRVDVAISQSCRSLES